jgi:hypothetical protein
VESYRSLGIIKEEQTAITIITLTADFAHMEEKKLR